MGAIKNAIQRDELDPTVMELDPEKSLASQRPANAKEEEDETSPRSPMETERSDSEVVDSHHHRTNSSGNAWSSRLGFPSDWQAPPQEGKNLNNTSTRALPVFPVDESDGDEISNSDRWGEEGPPPLNIDPTYEKYYRMLKMVSLVCDI